MKKIFAILAVASLGLTLYSCGNDNTNSSDNSNRTQETNPNAVPAVESTNPGGEIKDTTHEATKTDHQDPANQTEHNNH